MGPRTHARRTSRGHAGVMDLATVRDLAAATPASRNRVVDLLRAAAILVVVLGHWLLAAVVVRDGELDIGHLLDLAPWTHPLTWVFQVMPVFFLVGGYANALSWRSAAPPGRDVCRLAPRAAASPPPPVVPLLLAWLVASSVAYSAGVPGATLRTASQVALVPTWFLAAYVVVCAVAPATLWLWERTGWWSVVGGLALGCVVDLVSIGTDTLAIGFANYLVVWATVHQLGYAWLDGRLAGTGRRLRPRGRRARRHGGARLGRAVPRVDDRPRRRRREQLLPDARDPRLPRAAAGGRRARARAGARPLARPPPRRGRRRCSSTPAS